MKVAIIGYGYWGINIAKAIQKSQNFELKTIFDTDSRRVGEAKKLYDFEVMDLEQIFKSEDIEALFIITPPQTHYKIAKRAIESGKHIFVEKPITTELRGAYELYELAEKNKVIIHCDHIFLYSPAIRYLQDNIKDFGNIAYINSRRINLGLFQSSVDVIWDLAIHDLSIIDVLVGLDIKKVSTFSKKYQSYPNDALANINLELNNGVIATINVSWLSPIKVREMMIGGSKKSAIYDETKSEKIRVFDSGVIIKDEFELDNLYQKMVEYKLGDEEIPKLDKYLPLDESIGFFYKQIQEKIQKNKEHTLRVIKALEIISKT